MAACVQAYMRHRRRIFGISLSLVEPSPVSTLSGKPFPRLLCAHAGLSEAVAPQLATFGISLSLVEPGPVSTPFQENINKNASEDGAEEKPDDYT